MPVSLLIAWRHARGQPVRTALTLSGLGLGIAMLVWSLALGFGVRQLVLTQLMHAMPIDIIECRAEGVDLGFLQMPAGGALGGARLDDARVAQLAQLPHAKAAYAKRDVALPLGAQGGQRLFGRTLYADLFITALPQALVQSEQAKAFVDLEPGQEEQLDAHIIPLVIAPTLIDLYNASVAPALGTPVISAEHLIGFRFDLVVGRSLMLGERGARQHGTQQAQIVGVSPHAAPLGGTIPTRFAQALWAKYAPAGRAPTPCPISSILVQAQSAQDIVGLTDGIEALGLVTDRTAERVRHVLWGATALLATAGLLVLGLAASQTAFGLSVYITEQRRSWAILRAMGFNCPALIAIILLQAAGLGILGGTLGLGLALAASRAADTLAHNMWPAGLTAPHSLFVFFPELGPGALVAAMAAGVLGALGPAIAAARRPIHAGLRD